MVSFEKLCCGMDCMSYQSHECNFCLLLFSGSPCYSGPQWHLVASFLLLVFVHRAPGTSDTKQHNLLVLFSNFLVSFSFIPFFFLAATTGSASPSPLVSPCSYLFPFFLFHHVIWCLVSHSWLVESE